MPRLVRLYIRQVLIGFAVSAAFVALLLGFNVANLWHLVTATSGGTIAVVMLWIFNGIVFAGVQFSISVMNMAEKNDPPGGGRRDALPVLQTDPVPVRVAAKR
ncbi:hypothetical protein [Shimia biformata]|uniref:hypothetical protein n=1 Tax=Shimia biformata TaxID=1294299 RepID=UPI001951E3A4|nr:hypothetical protein [Shimia biformata]